MLDDIVNAMLPIIVTAFSTLITWFIAKIKSIYDTKIKNETVKEIINTTVKYINQVYKDAIGSEKFAKAKEKIINWLNEENIKIDETRLMIMIESAVHTNKTSSS
jgi:hypothetical protein